MWRCIILAALASTLAFQSITRGDGDKPVSPVGAWNMKGTDSLGDKTIGTMILKRDTSESQASDKLTGYVDWLSDKRGVRLHLMGTYDPETRTLKLKSVKAEMQNGYVNGTWTVKLSSNGNELRDGKLVEPASDRAEWSATREVIE